MSTLVGDIVDQVWQTEPDFPPHIIASALAVIAGGIVCGLGLLRLGWLVDFIPLVSISAFMTGSAIFIAVGQVPNLMGISVTADFNTRAQTYKVVINTLQALGQTRIDAAMGLTALFHAVWHQNIFQLHGQETTTASQIVVFC